MQAARRGEDCKAIATGSAMDAYAHGLGPAEAVYDDVKRDCQEWYRRETERLRARLAEDYNRGKYSDVIADAAALQKLGDLDRQMALVAAQAYYKVGNLAGCAKYIQENPYLSKDSMMGAGHPAAELLQRCQQSRLQP